jgi:hypothetical protein
MSDAKGKGNATTALPVYEAVAGSGLLGTVDGPLCACTFSNPIALCRFGDSLFVADYISHVIRQVDGVLGMAVPHSEGTASLTESELEARAVPLIMAALA